MQCAIPKLRLSAQHTAVGQRSLGKRTVTHRLHRGKPRNASGAPEQTSRGVKSPGVVCRGILRVGTKRMDSIASMIGVQRKRITMVPLRTKRSQARHLARLSRSPQQATDDLLVAVRCHLAVACPWRRGLTALGASFHVTRCKDRMILAPLWSPCRIWAIGIADYVAAHWVEID